MGIGGALFEAIEFDNGKILNPHLAKYRVPRFSDMPVIETVLVDRKDLPSAGAGETPIVGVAPAVGNAIFQAHRHTHPVAADGPQSVTVRSKRVRRDRRPHPRTHRPAAARARDLQAASARTRAAEACIARPSWKARSIA